MFTTQHYIKIAKVIRNIQFPVEKADLIHQLATMFGEDNSLFNYGLFFDECNLEREKSWKSKLAK